VTTEDDFHTALDANPEDWQTRLVFADWLEERGDPRAEGYRALGARRLRPNKWVQLPDVFHWWWGGDEVFWRNNTDVVVLPRDWFEALPDQELDRVAWPWHDDPNTRRAAEDAAAAGFARLPPERRAALLAPPAAEP
jgi:uncharacterized protein (TIGR02996 family)